jgi:hypothetical protein
MTETPAPPEELEPHEPEDASEVDDGEAWQTLPLS